MLYSASFRQPTAAPTEASPTCPIKCRALRPLTAHTQPVRAVTTTPPCKQMGCLKAKAGRAATGSLSATASLPARGCGAEAGSSFRTSFQADGRHAVAAAQGNGWPVSLVKGSCVGPVWGPLLCPSKQGKPLARGIGSRAAELAKHWIPMVALWRWSKGQEASAENCELA